MTRNFHQEKILILPPALIGEIFIDKLTEVYSIITSAKIYFLYAKKLR